MACTQSTLNQLPDLPEVMNKSQLLNLNSWVACRAVQASRPQIVAVESRFSVKTQSRVVPSEGRSCPPPYSLT